MADEPKAPPPPKPPPVKPATPPAKQVAAGGAAKAEHKPPPAPAAPVAPPDPAPPADVPVPSYVTELQAAGPRGREAAQLFRWCWAGHGSRHTPARRGATSQRGRLRSLFRCDRERLAAAAATVRCGVLALLGSQSPARACQGAGG